MDGCALECTGCHRSSGSNDDKGHACPDEFSVGPLNSETQIKVKNRYLCYGNTGVIYNFAKEVHLSLESVFGLSVNTCLVYLISSDALKLVSGGKS